LFLSPVSIWEARHLVRRKRLRIETGFSDWLEIVFARVPLTEAPFNFAVAVEASVSNCRTPIRGMCSWPQRLRFSG